MYLAHGPAAHIRLTVVGLTFALMLAGCDDPPVGPNQRESAQRPASRSRVTILTLDDAFRAIAEEVPAFAGLYVDHAGSLVVLSTDEASGEQIKTALEDPSRINYWLVAGVALLFVGVIWFVRRWFLKEHRLAAEAHRQAAASAASA